MNEEIEEKNMLDMIRAGDADGFDLMVERYGPMLYRYARRMCGNVSDAEDALQDTFLTAQEKIAQFRGEGRLRNWLFKIAGNNCRQKHRSQAGRKAELRLDDVLPLNERLVNKEPAAWQLNPAERMLTAELKKKLEQAIAKVPLTNRSVLILRDLEGLSTRETAQSLNITEETVKVRLHRARAYIRNLLRRYFEEG